MPERTIIEICIASVEDAIVAQAGGADRVELNAALELGGLTPSLGAMREVRQAVSLPIVAMVRPRPGDFCYSDSDLRIMSRDIELMLEAGADGIAFGILSVDGRVDVGRCKQLIRLVRPSNPPRWQGPVFHRAFDFVSDPFNTLETLIDLGFQRVMTSGQCPAAMEGSTLIRMLMERARGRIEILPAGGIRPSNVQALLQQTGCNQVHASLRAPSTVKVGSMDFGSCRLSLIDPKVLREFVEAARLAATRP